MLRKLVIVIAVAGCNDHIQGIGPDAAIDATVEPLTLGALMPQDTVSNPTAILATPAVVAITYDNDTNRANIESFYREYAASTAWATTTAEYGIGPLTVTAPQHLAGNAPAKISDGDTSDITALLTANLTGANPAWGPPSPDTLYAFFFPLGSIVDDGTAAAPDPCCAADGGYDGYHYDVMIGSVDVTYSIQCQCAADFDPGLTPLQQLTIVAGHELVEAVTDPHISTTLGWGQTDAAHAVWTYVTEGELADLCEFADTYPWLTPPDMTFATQRIWSNAAARAGHDPCVGDPTSPYYQTVPEQPDPLSVTFEDAAVATVGVQLALSTPGMLTLHVFADQANAGPFNVTVDDLDSFFAGGVANGAVPDMLSITQPTGTFHSGDTLTVPIQVIATDPMLTGGETFIVTTKPVSGTGPGTYYFGLIGQ